jgi:branched-chain amino acid transport system permease protein
VTERAAAAGTAPASRLTARTRATTVFALAAAAIVLVWVGPLFLDAYTINILVRSFLYACVALTVDVLWGYMGVLTFGQSAFFGIGAYAAGLTFNHLGFSAANAAMAFAGALVAAAAIAWLVGWLAFGPGASQLYASVITLVLPIVMTQVIFSGGTFTGSSSGLSGFETVDLSFEGWFRLAGIALVLLTTLTWFFVKSDAGKLLVGIRENELRCRYLGLDPQRVKLLVFIAAALVGAAAGFAYACFTSVIAPELAGFVFGTELVVWVALGGRGTLIGPVLGTILIDWSTAQLSGEFPFVWKLILGIVFVLVIVLFPRGLGPVVGDTLGRLWRMVVRRPAAGEAHDRLAVASGGTRAKGQGDALAIADVTKSFGSLKVLSGINLAARAGELVSLVGPNGAGKTTLMRCIADGAERSSGTIALNGVDIGRKPPEDCVALGVGRKFQTANIFETLTVRDCLRIARSRIDRPALFGEAETIALPEAALHVIRATGLDRAMDTPARLLSHGMKQALELAMVLALEPSILLLDEPTAGLTKPERMLIGEILSELAGRGDICILLVEHDLEFVRQISSRVVVLHQGAIVLDGTVADVVGSDLVKAIYAGSGHQAEAAR